MPLSRFFAYAAYASILSTPSMALALAPAPSFASDSAAPSFTDPEAKLASLRERIDRDEARLNYTEGYFTQYDRVTNRTLLKPFKWMTEGLGKGTELRAQSNSKVAAARQHLSELRKEVAQTQLVPVSGAHARNDAQLKKLETLTQSLHQEVDEATTLRRRFEGSHETGGQRANGAICATAGVIIIAASGGTFAPAVAELGSAMAPALTLAGGAAATLGGAVTIATTPAEKPLPSSPAPNAETTMEVELPETAPSEAASQKLESQEKLEDQKQFEQLISKKPTAHLDARAQGRPAAALVAEAQAAVKAILNDQDFDTQKLGQFILDTEALPPPGEKKSHLLELEYQNARQQLGVLGDEVKKIFSNPALSPLQKVDALSEKVIKKLENYVPSLALLSDCFSSRGCNCDGRTRVYASALASANASLPAPFKFGLQHYNGHIQFVLIDTKENKVWDLVSGGAYKPRVLGPILDPKEFYASFLHSRGLLSDAQAKALTRKLTLVEASPLTAEDQAREAKIQYKNPKTNTNLKYLASGLRHASSGPPPPFAQTAAPKKLEDRPESHFSDHANQASHTGAPSGLPNTQANGERSEDWKIMHASVSSKPASQPNAYSDPFTYLDRRPDAPGLVFEEPKAAATFSEIREPQDRARYLRLLLNQKLQEISRRPEASDYLAYLRNPSVLLTWTKQRAERTLEFSRRFNSRLSKASRITQPDQEADPTIRELLIEQEAARDRIFANPRGVLKFATQITQPEHVELFSEVLRSLSEGQVLDTEIPWNPRLRQFFMNERFLEPLGQALNTPGLVAIRAVKKKFKAPPPSRTSLKTGTESDVVAELQSEPLAGTNSSPTPARFHLSPELYMRFARTQFTKQNVVNMITPEYIRSLPLSVAYVDFGLDIQWLVQTKEIRPGTPVVEVPGTLRLIGGTAVGLLPVDLAREIAERNRELLRILQAPDKSRLRNAEEREIYRDYGGNNVEERRDFLKKLDDALAKPTIFK